MENKYYKGYTEPVKRYQKSENYKKYRRVYEEGYRNLNRVEVSFSSWYNKRLKEGKRTSNYLVNLYLLLKYAGIRFNDIKKVY